MISKREALTRISSFLQSCHDESLADCIVFCENELKNMDMKAQLIREQRQKESASNDALCDAVAEVVGEDFLTAPEIVELVSVDATAAKVHARAKVLIEDGLLEKGSKTINGKSFVAYRHT